jgi:uncharacterized protein YndB with AHSA1/START domain
MDNIRLITTLPASPEAVYEAWLSTGGHTAMTGAPATVEARVGGEHMAWGGYISGQHVELEPGKRILQTWRTTEFPENAPDSLLEIVLTRAPEGTRLTLTQSGIPDGQGEQYHEGWQGHYFAPMTAYFAAAKPKPRARKAKAGKNAKAARAAATAGPAKKAKGVARKATLKRAKKAKPPAKRAKPRGHKAKPRGHKKASKK